MRRGCALSPPRNVPNMWGADGQGPECPGLSHSCCAHSGPPCVGRWGAERRRRKPHTFLMGPNHSDSCANGRRRSRRSPRPSRPHANPGDPPAFPAPVPAVRVLPWGCWRMSRTRANAGPRPAVLEGACGGLLAKQPGPWQHTPGPSTLPTRWPPSSDNGCGCTGHAAHGSHGSHGSHGPHTAHGSPSDEKDATATGPADSQQEQP